MTDERTPRPPGEEPLDERHRRIEDLVAGLPRIDPSPQFEARFRARLARAEDERNARGWRARLGRLSPLEWVAAAAAVAALAVLLLRGDAPLPPVEEGDWTIVSEADAEGFDLLMDEDLEMLSALDVLEAWDGSEEI